MAPAQNAYMCRLRVPNGILTHWQLAGVAAIAERYCHGYAHVTTRANLQVREIAAENAIAVLEELAVLGLATKGSGADNIRNVTGSPTAGIDPQELLDTRPYARAWHHHILNDRSLYGLPRKFNVGFDGGGVVPVLEDTNDIAFTAVRVARQADGSRPASGSAWVSAASPATRTSPGRPACWLSPTRRLPWPTPSCACSSTTAIAPTARRHDSSTCSMPGASRSSWRPSRPSSDAR